jgi:hypothetical protein
MQTFRPSLSRSVSTAASEVDLCELPIRRLFGNRGAVGQQIGG